MFEFTKDERAYLERAQSLETDNEGREIILGLTHDETVFFTTYSRKKNSGDPGSPEDDERYEKLKQRNQQTLFAYQGTDPFLNTTKPTKH